MSSFKKLTTIAGWAVFAIAMVVYFFSAERTGSLWDCGEFVLGAYKLQVVHPPGAPLFLLIGRIFTWIADVVSSDPANIAFAVNLMSGMFTAFAAAFVAWTTMIFSRMTFVGREVANLTKDQEIVVAAAGLVAGLATAFCSSIWFSAVEGEVYAMSTFFTAMTLWAIVKWYGLPDDSKADRWLIFAFYSGGLSIGVHLLSLLTFPAMAMFYYLKKSEKPKLFGAIIAIGIGAIIIPIVQQVIIVGIPKLWATMELMMVNGLGMPFHSGLIPTFLILGGVLFFALRWAHKNENGLVQRIAVAFTVMAIGFSAIGIVVIRANADTPINMNEPSDVMRLIPYLNREQYGERALFHGPHFDAQPVDLKKSDRYGRVGDKYEVVDHQVAYEYADKDKMLFPRISHSDQNRVQLHRMWMGDSRPPDMAYNLSFMFRYQIGWMYIRYFMWNFAGRQNGEQGYYPWNVKSGHWLSGIPFLDSSRLYNQSELPETIKNDHARNKYYLLPLIFGFIGFFWHVQRRRKDWLGLMIAFLFLGLGIIFYTNQPPNEPRERDYVLVGSFFVFCMWIGMAVPAIYEFARSKLKSLDGRMTAIVCGVLVLLAPILMGVQNFDDHSRRKITAARDYASNFLESCDPNSIIFTYGDNDTYPLWYCQEVEGIRTDVRVINLSLIAVDWYINGLRKRVNDSPAIKYSIPEEAYRGDARNALYALPNSTEQMGADRALKIMGENHPISAGGQTLPSYLPSTNLYIPIDLNRAKQIGWLRDVDTANVIDRIPVTISNSRYNTKDEVAVLDIITSNMYDRPIYFSVTCKEDKLMGMQDYTRLEGLGLKVVPVRTPSNKSFYIYGSGSIDADKVYDRVMHKWRWGNFDKEQLVVDNSYAPSLQAMKMIIWRGTQELLREGDNERAIALTDKYFEAFPHMNFPYDARTLIHISFYLQAGAPEKAKEHLSILVPELADWLNFYESIGPDKIDAGFRNDYELTKNAVLEISRMADQIGDEVFTQEVQDHLGPYLPQKVLN
jgi:hypothetical protein